MKIKLITAKVQMPEKQVRHGYTQQGRAERELAFTALRHCEVGQHVRFENTERSRVLGYLQHETFINRKYELRQIAELTHGAWRTQ